MRQVLATRLPRLRAAGVIGLLIGVSGPAAEPASAQTPRSRASVRADAPPLPPRRPEGLGQAPAAETPAPAAEVQGPPIPTAEGPPVPAEEAPAQTAEGVPLPPPRPDFPATVETAPAPVADGEAAACRDRLARLGVRFETRPPILNGSCGAAEPLVVSRLSEALEVAPPATMTCPVAEALAAWARESLVPEAERHLRTAPTKLAIGTSYECRSQRSGAKLSEHAFANAVDVMGLGFAGRAALPIAPRGDGSPEAAFQAAVQKGACAHFTTVLGPGSDAAHDDHLHLDLRGRKGGYRICQ